VWKTNYSDSHHNLEIQNVNFQHVICYMNFEVMVTVTVITQVIS
jgi:hypothetical protein